MAAKVSGSSRQEAQEGLGQSLAAEEAENNGLLLSARPPLSDPGKGCPEVSAAASPAAAPDAGDSEFRST